MPKKTPYWKNPEKYRKKSREYSRKKYKEDPLYRKIKTIKSYIWKKTTPKGKYFLLRIYCRKRKMPIGITKEEYVNWWNSQKNICYYCGKSEEKSKLETDRLDNTQTYKIGNIKLVCHACNSVKGEILTEKEMLIVGKLIMEARWKKKLV